ncbi:uncharacterized protein LOC106477048 isoform X1 [Limulus polyphemus]|uniref:Uncharacterized protein LOC106477048 isoform X1 n=1 Tax=Limulus polyphemus TaxID=6850 RepID=A0ABM1RYL0_LIMPO|nr:uncharacterized protein LOC106477048 isoform X1 [Limulus polyphemus]
MFDKPGIYQVRLVGNKTVIAISPHIQVIWSSHYHLSVPQPYIFPCQEGVLTIYEYPPCILTEDRIRVYGRRLSSSTTDYIFETKVSTSKHALALPCGIFSSQYQSFCFTYTSVAASGAVFELKTFCRPRNIEQGRRRASWSGWSNWSRCSSTCGAGIRSRYRLCHSPSSASYCSGKSIESVVCVVKECIEETTLMTEDFLQHLECNCSCNLNITGNGTLVVKLLYCDHVPLFWTLKALPEGSLNIMFHEVNLDSQFWLTVREGASIVGPILAIVTNQMTSVFVNSHSSTVRIELQSSNVSIIPEGEITLKFFKENLKVSSLTADWNDTPGKAQFSSVHLTLGAMAFVVSCVILIMLLSKQIYSKFRQKHHSVSSESFSSSLCDIGVSIPKVHLLGGATSISELSCSPPSLRRQITTPKKVSSQENISPEDFLYNTFLFHSTSSIYTLTPPSSSLIQRRVLMSGSKKKLSVSPKPQPKSERASQVRRQLLKTARKDRPVDRLKEESVTPGGKGAAASTQSLSEVSVEGSEDGFEYDYYDYSCHNDPGSFFCTDPTLMGWPPFIPIYPGMSEEELPLRDFPIIQKETTDQDSGVS